MSDGSGLRAFSLVALGLAVPLAGWAIATEEWRLLALLVVAGLAPMVSRWSFALTIGAYALVVPFDAVLSLGEEAAGPTLTRYVGIAAGAVLAATAVLRGRLVWPPRALWWWLLLLVWSAGTAVWAADPSLVRGQLPTAVSLFLLYAVVACVRVSRREALTAGALAVLGGVIAAGYVQYLYTQGVSFLESTQRASLVVGAREANPNLLAASLLLPLALAVGGFLGGRGWVTRLGAIAAIAVIAAGLYLTMSRGALVALVAMSLGLLYRFRASWRVMVPIGLLGILAVGMPETFFERIFAAADDEGAGRLDIWRVGLVALREYGLFGAGLGHFPNAYDEWVSFAPGAYAGASRAAHNTYLSTWVETGAVGLVLLLGACLSQLRAAAWTASDRTREGSIYLFALEAACIGGLAAGFFGDNQWLKAFWLQWIFLVAALRACEDDEGTDLPMDVPGGNGSARVAPSRRAEPQALSGGSGER
jgi:O-antigen ligase